MRIVHNIYNKRPQCSGSSGLYAYSITKPPPEFPGFRCDLLACDSDEDVIYLEGDGRAIKNTLKQLLALVDDMESRHRQEWDVKRPTIKQCPKCESWTNDEHACYDLQRCATCNNARMDHEPDAMITYDGTKTCVSYKAK